jgi:hypothetical protein
MVTKEPWGAAAESAAEGSQGYLDAGLRDQQLRTS